MANQSQNLDDPSLCVNNCGFFGNQSTNNLCSKCYKEYIMKHSHEEIKENNIESVVSDETLVDVGGSHTTSTSNVENRAANRCNLCKKKVGLTGFKCRCGHTFCSSHRYSDKHGCIFDYKGAGQDAIARANPVVKADKIEKI